MSVAASYVRLLNGYFSRADYFQADVEKGTIRTPTGTRICTLTDDFLLGFRTAVQFECGKATDRVFKACGKRWGRSFVERFDRELTEHYGVPLSDVSTGLVERCLGEAFRYYGWGNLTIDLAEYDAGLVSVEVADPMMPAVVGTADKPSDALFAGFFAAVFGYFAKTDLDCQQTDCPTRGADRGRFVVGLPDRLKSVPKWVAEKLSHATVIRRLKAAVPLEG
jgi:predicted hydrocarbon binding protein